MQQQPEQRQLQPPGHQQLRSPPQQRPRVTRLMKARIVATSSQTFRPRRKPPGSGMLT